MIQIEEIEIVEFRGIRHLKRSSGRKSFGIAGPNGTGKSGIVDAIEFALTGNITRLGGAGTAELSVKAHAPHVDASKKPETALVRLQVYAPALKKSFIIERSVKNPGARYSSRAVLKPGRFWRSSKPILSLPCLVEKSSNIFSFLQANDHNTSKSCCALISSKSCGSHSNASPTMQNATTEGPRWRIGGPSPISFTISALPLQTKLICLLL